MNDAKATVTTLKDAMLSLNQAQLHTTVTSALARMDYYSTHGHNFFGQQDQQAMQVTMNSLQQLIMSGATTLGTTTALLRADANYTTEYNLIDTLYTETRKKFKENRLILGLKYAALGAAIASGARRALHGLV